MGVCRYREFRLGGGGAILLVGLIRGVVMETVVSKVRVGEGKGRGRVWECGEGKGGRGKGRDTGMSVVTCESLFSFPHSYFANITDSFSSFLASIKPSPRPSHNKANI